MEDGWDGDSLFKYCGYSQTGDCGPNGQRPTFSQRMADTMDWANDFFDYNSQGRFQLQPTITAPVSVSDITSSTCHNFSPLGSSSSSNTIDVKAFAAAGYDYPPLTPSGVEFDFWWVGTPRCMGWGWGGIGRVGGPGLIVNRVSGSTASTFIHELGHNLGLNHCNSS